MNFSFLILTLSLAWAAGRPADVVDIKKIDPSIEVRMVYFTDMNFVGKKVDGYKANICYLSEPAAQALKKAQAKLKKKNAGLTLMVYDCYRPQKAVAHFVRWVNSEDISTQATFYPELTKEQLIKDGYIAPLSEHSRANAVDLTIASKSGEELIPVEMGGLHDYFGEKSHTNYPAASTEAKTNRKMLAEVMTPEFAPYPQEWWHFTFRAKTQRQRMDFDVAP